MRKLTTSSIVIYLLICIWGVVGFLGLDSAIHKKQEYFESISSGSDEEIKKITLFDNLNRKQKIGQLLFVAIPDNTSSLSAQTRELLNQIQPGGVLLLGINSVSELQVKNLIADIRQSLLIPPFIAVDYEGQYAPFTFIKKDTIQTLRELGINTLFGPIVDIATKDAYIKKRTLATEEAIVIRKAKDIILNQLNNKMCSTLKHFPGIGTAVEDPHKHIGIISSIQEEPYKTLYNGVQFIMTSHVRMSSTQEPATFDSNIIAILDKYPYRGIIITDDMHMASVNNTELKYFKALSAGHTMILDLDNLDNVEKNAQRLSTMITDSDLNSRLQRIYTQKKFCTFLSSL